MSILKHTGHEGQRPLLPKIAICCALASTGVTGCGLGHAATQSPSHSTHGSDTSVPPHLDGSTVVTYSTLAQVGRAAPEVIIATAGASQDAGPGDENRSAADVHALLSTLHVEETLKGDLPAGVNISVRQLFAAGYPGSASVPFAAGTEYVVYLTPFTWRQDEPSNGEWNVTGGIAAYAVDEDAASTSGEPDDEAIASADGAASVKLHLAAQGSDDAGLPETVSLADVIAALD